RRPLGDIQPRDLPGYCSQSSLHTLTPIEAAERDTIITALRDAAGNRVQAAARLGIARSSLYRKIKTFGIDDV
ncbi:MAG: helix-turn-helix domain-containing protein, partial [Rhodococcus sp. (in: high G+C Gram-positive bacteria)]|uniref:helix-turn-helix domain-containing protein n=1 Tax=Rhodococcus sp. TaxID=1831 RepID=UPI003BB00BE3